MCLMLLTHHYIINNLHKLLNSNLYAFSISYVLLFLLYCYEVRVCEMVHIYLDTRADVCVCV